MPGIRTSPRLVSSDTKGFQDNSLQAQFISRPGGNLRDSLSDLESECLNFTEENTEVAREGESPAQGHTAS